ncbi:MAG TPA: ABC transporter ATP-binding protein [Candidatus Binataceae bacterium]|nr:ABC transporter ATP-binding protein [Candidatus Binataceae bacterium]
MAGALSLIIGLSLTEGIGVALMLPTLQAAGLNLGHQGAAAYYVKLIERAFGAIGMHPGFIGWLGLCAAVLIARNLTERHRHVSTFAVQLAVEDALRRRLYRAIANADWRFIARARTSDFLHALTSEIERVTIAVLSFMMLAGELALAALYAAIALALSVPMTLIVVGCGLGLAFAMRSRTARIESRGREAAETIARFYAGASEYLASLKAAKSYCAEERNYEIYSATCSRLVEVCNANVREQSAAASWFELGGWAVMLPIFYVAVREIRLPAAELLILLGLFWRLMPRFQSCHTQYQNLRNTLPSFVNLIALEARCLAAAEPAQSTAKALELEHEIRFENVSFAYNPDAGPTLSNINLTIPAGRITALVGASGAGKSTIADLLMGLVTPASGEITIDGTVLPTDAVRAWRQQIGYVGQETPLFHLSVRENLLWARPDADEAMLWRALREAAAEDFIRSLPHGLDTNVGERGVLVSQGERQRIALARALLRHPSILVLDEATNSLDYDKEAKVLNAIEALRGELTVVMIAHRLSTIRWADLIYVVENGAVVEFGGWDELNARRGGRFRALCDAQRLVA